MSRRRTRNRAERLRPRALLVVGAGLGGLLALGLAAPSSVPAPLISRHGSFIAPSDASSASWICAGLKAGSHSAVVLENTTDHAVTGTMDVVGARRVLEHEAIGVGARSRALLSVVLPHSASFAAAFLDLSSGGVLVSEAIHWNRLDAAVACGSTPSSAAYLPDGVSTRHTSSMVTVANPSSTTPAVVSMTAVTAQGVVEPAPLQGIVIGPERAVAVDLATYVLNQPSFSTAVVALSGRVVVSEDELGWGQNRFFDLVAAQPALAPVNVLSFEEKTSAQDQIIDLTNFSSQPVPATLEVTLPSGVLAPSTVMVPARDSVGLPVSGLAGVPAGFPFTVSVTSPVGALTVSRLSRDFDGVALWRSAEAGEPVNQLTSNSVLAAPASTNAALRWRQLTVANVAGRPITVRLEALTPAGMVSLTSAPLRLGTGQVVTVSGGLVSAASTGQETVVAAADGPVIVSGRTQPSLAPTGLTLTGSPAAP